MIRPRQPERPPVASGDGEDGFVLLETIVALSLITVILAALGGFTLTSIDATNDLRARQTAVQVATSATQAIDSLQATDLLSGRGRTAVTSQVLAAPTVVQPYLATMVPSAFDISLLDPTAGASASIPTVAQTRTLNNITYSVNTYLGYCWMPRTTMTSASCTATQAVTTDPAFLRAVVAVTWPGSRCAASLCSYITSTLVDIDADATFSATIVPSAPPTITNPGAQTSTIGSTVSLQLGVTGGAGSPVWTIQSGALPAGLGMDSTGLITGSPTTLTTVTSVTVQVADAYGRAAVTTFTWAVVGPPTIGTPTGQTATVGAASTLTPTFTCPNAPCTFTISGAPTGLSINASTGVVTGAPTSVGTSSTTITVTDAGGVSVSTAVFSWTVVRRATLSNPGTMAFTVGQTPAVYFTYSCPTTTCTIALSNTVPGLGLSTSPSASNNTVTSLSVSGSATSFFVTGRVQASAVTGDSRSYAPSLTITDSSSNVTTSSTGSWTAYATPTIGALAAKTTTLRATPSVGLAWTCPISSCRITLGGSVPGLGLSTTAGATSANSTNSVSVTGTSGTIYYTGQVSASAVTSGTSTAYSPTITITDASLLAASTGTTWTVSSGPVLTNPGTQVNVINQTLAIQFSAVCPNTCSSWSATYATGSSTTYTSVPISSTGRLTTSTNAVNNYTYRVTVTDSGGLTDTVSFVLKSVSSITVSVPTQTTAKPSSGTTTATLDASTLVSPQGGYTYSLSGAPSWLTIDPSTGMMTATVTPTSTSDTSITVTMTSTASSLSTGSTTFAWNIS